MGRKIKSVVDILAEQYQKDFNLPDPETSLAFETQLVYAIQHCNRSLEEQKTEAIAKIELGRQGNETSLVSLILSFTAISISVLFNMVNMLAAESAELVAIISSLTLLAVLYFTIKLALKQQNKRCESCAYYAVKLEHIEKLKKEMEETQEKTCKNI